MLKETTDVNKWEDTYAHGLEDLTSPRQQILPKLTHRFSGILIKTPGDITTETVKPILKFLWKPKESRITKTMLTKNKVGAFILPTLKTYYKAPVIKTVWC